MIRLFDEHDIAFVSVTQQFNTGSSMGRLVRPRLFRTLGLPLGRPEVRLCNEGLWVVNQVPAFAIASQKQVSAGCLGRFLTPAFGSLWREDLVDLGDDTVLHLLRQLQLSQSQIHGVQERDTYPHGPIILQLDGDEMRLVRRVEQVPEVVYVNIPFFEGTIHRLESLFHESLTMCGTGCLTGFDPVRTSDGELHTAS